MNRYNWHFQTNDPSFMWCMASLSSILDSNSRFLIPSGFASGKWQGEQHEFRILIASLFLAGIRAEEDLNSFLRNGQSLSRCKAWTTNSYVRMTFVEQMTSSAAAELLNIVKRQNEWKLTVAQMRNSSGKLWDPEKCLVECTCCLLRRLNENAAHNVIESYVFSRK